jgi:hypothetical protein
MIGYLAFLVGWLLIGRLTDKKEDRTVSKYVDSILLGTITFLFLKLAGC